MCIKLGEGMKEVDVVLTTSEVLDLLKKIEGENNCCEK